MKEGVNPDAWFNQVEHVAVRRVGQETVSYVSNIFKYYVTYRLARQTETDRVIAIEQLKRKAKDAAQDDKGDP